MLLRNLLLRMAANQRLVDLFARLGTRYGLARRFIAGERMEDAVRVVQGLNRIGVLASLDYLGEGVRDEQEAGRTADSCIRLLQTIAESRIQSNISIKPTQLGLNIDPGVCEANLERILQEARRLGNFVRMDMEGSDHTEGTMRLFNRAYARFGDRVGIVIQSYLYRSERDVQALCTLGCNVRLCKGAYMEPPQIAFPRKADVDRNFLKLLELLLESPCYTAIATHDDRMVRHAQEFVEEHSIDGSRYEFQMLYGIRRESQREIARQGCRMRVYVPFGTQWAPYFLRRLAERPANVLFVLRNLFRG